MSEQLRPEVLTFAWLMELRLREHDHERGRRGWTNAWTTEQFLLSKLREEYKELVVAYEGDAPKETVALEAADLGNLAMMIADRSGGLAALQEVSGE